MRPRKPFYYHKRIVEKHQSSCSKRTRRQWQRNMQCNFLQDIPMGATESARSISVNYSTRILAVWKVYPWGKKIFRHRSFITCHSVSKFFKIVSFCNIGSESSNIYCQRCYSFFKFRYFEIHLKHCLVRFVIFVKMRLFCVIFKQCTKQNKIYIASDFSMHDWELKMYST